jgi:hypothetical protein
MSRGGDSEAYSNIDYINRVGGGNIGIGGGDSSVGVGDSSIGDYDGRIIGDKDGSVDVVGVGDCVIGGGGFVDST